MVTAEELEARREEIAASVDLTALLGRLSQRAVPVLERMPEIPAKALLSVDGGVCPKDGTALTFDPWSPRAHHCPSCGGIATGERHHRHWAKFQHLWLAERAAHLATLAALGENPAAASRARALLSEYGERYLDFPNRDNVLGPSRLFFSTYLESVWLLNYLAAAELLRLAGALDDETARRIAGVAEEAANLIADFNEGLSNRQTWHSAALAAIAAWFEDEDLASRAIEGPTGLLAHLMHGFGRDGLWYEGENYHLFALRGLLLGLGWARQAGLDVAADAEFMKRLHAALLAPALTALPDHTFPARKDSRYGVSLAQPMYLELWEVGLARLRAAGTAHQTEVADRASLEDWLALLYSSAAAPSQTFESYLHESREPDPVARSRAELSWWSLLEMAPVLKGNPERWSPHSVLFESQGLAILRGGSRYVSLECGAYGGGHGHPDRLHLTLHADGVHWLRDYGTGSYVSPDLFWYRATLAHNAPRLDGVSQPPGDASCEMFDVHGEWSWVRGRYGDVSRTVVAGPEYVLDLVELAGRDEHRLELPWHFSGGVQVCTPGRWARVELADEFVTDAERFLPETVGPTLLQATSISPSSGREHGSAGLTAHFATSGELLRASGPGVPDATERRTFYLMRAQGSSVRLLTVLLPSPSASSDDQTSVRAIRASGDVIEIDTASGLTRHRLHANGCDIDRGAVKVRLAGRRQTEGERVPLLNLNEAARATGAALWVDDCPALDGTLDGFDLSEPLLLVWDDQYRRSEEPYPGPEEFSAAAYVNWNEEALYVAVEVTKPELLFRDAAAPPLLLDNETDEIHSDGLQLYLKQEGGEALGFVIVPENEHGGLRVRGVGGTAADPAFIRGRWERTDTGYRVTCAIAPRDWSLPHRLGHIEFDLLVNEMRPERQRRAGQLVWSGGNGWVWLRGDRQDPARFGVLELR